MKNKSKLTKLAMATSLVISANSMAMESLTPEKKIIKFSSTETPLSQSLSQDYRFNIFTASAAKETQETIEASIAAADLVYVNLEGYSGEEVRLNQYLSEAFKQDKLIVLEKSNPYSEPVVFDALPISVNAEIVLYKPRYHTNNNSSQIYLFGDTQMTLEKKPTQYFLGDPETQQMVEVDGKGGNIKLADTITKTQLSSMSGNELSAALGQVKEAIQTLNSAYIPNTIKASNHSNIPTYECPDEAFDEKLCLITKASSLPYKNPDAEPDTTITSHYTVAMYRKEGDTKVYVAAYGSVDNPRMEKDHEQERGYFVRDLTVEVDTIPDTSYPRAPLVLYNSWPKNHNNVTSITTTDGYSFEIKATGGGAGDEPKWDLGGTFKYDSKTAKTMPLYDWATVAYGNGYNKEWDFSIDRYKTPGDWIKRGFLWRPLGFHEVPAMSKGGFHYVTESVWRGEDDITGKFPIQITKQFTNTFLWWAGYNHAAYDNITHTLQLPLIHADIDILKMPPED
ncbi:hypothetical protein EDC56_3020 [Sinobacterium caligoides]|uniref:Uncharacterized protein n=1 Tax=Sinobacterium caligoides TaxID=933926 RepID=A0A3N2DL14_9GAMM|nr:hypothetical protein [Sinobacterium caligoides]ROS00369.1 hypothetical protein EDC56_3020 [Sinobacterium caligoides]